MSLFFGGFKLIRERGQVGWSRSRDRFPTGLPVEIGGQGLHLVGVQVGVCSHIPSVDPRFSSVERPGTNPAFPTGAAFTSRWSERHAAYISGLGTFGLSKGLITERGVCGRFGSLITDAPAAATPRHYASLYEYCINCGACVRRCPAGAISLEGWKEHLPCSYYVDRTKKVYAPRYGCGKCQVAVPCESRISARRPVGSTGVK